MYIFDPVKNDRRENNVVDCLFRVHPFVVTTSGRRGRSLFSHHCSPHHNSERVLFHNLSPHKEGDYAHHKYRWKISY